MLNNLQDLAETLPQNPSFFFGRFLDNPSSDVEMWKFQQCLFEGDFRVFGDNTGFAEQDNEIFENR
jgi:hypothetical protein